MPCFIGLGDRGNMDLKKALQRLKSVPLRSYAPWAGAILAVVVFIVVAVSTVNDSQNKRELQNGIVTRFPINSGYFFGTEDIDADIILSWHDNTVRLKKDEASSLKLDAVLYPIVIEDRALTFTSSDTNLAEIDGEGNIIAKNPGSVEITVANAHTGIIRKAYLQIIQPVSGFYLNKSTMDVYMTDTGVRVEPVIVPSNASNSTVRWYSKDANIAEVDQTGYIKPKDTGLVEIVGTTADGGFQAKCFVNVINETIKVAKVSILNKEAELAAGESRHLIATIEPSNARNKQIQWGTSDPNIATVSKSGVVTGVNSGTAIITAIGGDGVSDSFEVSVSGNTRVPNSSSNHIASGNVTYIAYDLTLDEMAQLQMSTTPKYHDGMSLKPADVERTKRYLDPNEFFRGAYKYQFMDLSHYNGISRDSLAAFLDGKGILSGKADMFMAAARQYNVSELYLVAHACLETGYGSSQLATGVDYNGTRVYNMFGIGAYDSDAVGTGSKMAYQKGWTSPEAAILGGAKWISENYINAVDGRQNTLYKMRWNPDRPAQHLYAGDVSWAVSQALIMENLFKEFRDASIRYEVPVYAGAVAPTIDAGASIIIP